MTPTIPDPKEKTFMSIAEFQDLIFKLQKVHMEIVLDPEKTPLLIRDFVLTGVPKLFTEIFRLKLHLELLEKKAEEILKNIK